MKSKIINQLNQKDTELNSVIETILETETIIQMLESNYYQKSMENADIADVNINHLENIFTNETYYLAMKMVPLIERKVLYLSYIENLRLNDICKRLKLSKNEVIKLRTKGINHFKHNLELLYKTNKIRKGTI
ncbi:MAG: hypothetical protein EGQ16_02605 [Clostridiales bacterium]|nr:hypothetical protein [Clostridiales bacterium]